MKKGKGYKQQKAGPGYRIGLGYDIHRLVEGRKLIIGGEEIPYPRGLEGHSDADVLLHAICDALLGALGKGDIGEHFPNTDARYRNISSKKLLAQVGVLLQAEGFEIINIDSFIIAEEPQLRDFKQKMRNNIADVLSLAPSLVNIKATTNESLGPLGAKQGIAAYATVMLSKVSGRRTVSK
jgi:2-C-methyl-D-erythritol 2,4-cyclodiphosphate synthase